MEYIILIALVAVLIETSFLVYRQNNKQTRVVGQSIILDTSVLIDGRILSIARSGLITAPLVIPKSVLFELQFMADKADHDKRERARFGLEMVEKLQELGSPDVTVIDDGKIDSNGVDEQLLQLAQKYRARLCTIDYNLNKSARVQEVQVININELSHALRIVHLPGETVTIKLVQAGQEARQAVGYLDDGTMVVIDDAKSLIGQDIDVVITRVLQTAAGNMMFARKVGRGPAQTDTKKPQQPQTHTPKPQLQQAQVPKVQSQPQQPKQNGRRGRTSPEDSFVDLANR